MYIVCEWVVWTGKSTQSKRLVERLRETYPTQEVLLVREPGGTQIAEAIRTLVQATPFEETMQPLTDVYLYAAARAQLLWDIVKPALDRGAWVVSDRNVCSSLAYQWWTQGVGIDVVWQINAPAVLQAPPTALLFFDLPIDMWLSRVFDLQGDKRELKGKDFFVRVYEWYRQIPLQTPLGASYYAVDVTGSPDEVFEKLKQKVQETCLL